MAAGGKGHARRREDRAAVEANWERVFGKREPTAPSVLHSKVAEEESPTASEGAAVLDVCADGESHGSDHR